MHAQSGEILFIKTAKTSSRNSLKKLWLWKFVWGWIVELIKCLGWQSLEQRRDYYLATQMYKCVHGFAPKVLCDMIVMAPDVNVRNTRNTDSLNVYIAKPNIECYWKSFKCADGKFWNWFT